MQNPLRIIRPPALTPLVELAVRELRRYLYLRTGSLPAIAESGKGITLRVDPALGPEEYRLSTKSGQLCVTGGGELGLLYGAYRYVEKLGVSFYLHGDTLPDNLLSSLPAVEESGRPLFAVRGVNPWGWHPFGMDAWSADDYKAVIAQLTKMRMNFIGIHCYPEGLPQAEPTVWHGLVGDFDASGRVTRSYPSRYFNTLVGGKPWGDYLAKKTDEYSFGGALLFEDEAWSPNVFRGFGPRPVTGADCNEVFNRMGAQFHDAFSFARRLRVKTCLGTETPLTVPALVAERSHEARAVYEGTFRRIAAAHPLDYYWLWTPESWRAGNTPEQYSNTVADIRLAYDALQTAKAPFRLATSGWVIGPAQDRAAYDRDLPKDIAMSGLNRELGTIPVDDGFARVTGRGKWAIPWMENDVDDGLAGLQLTAGNLRRDAADALKYGCDGLIGLHWRTEIVSPNVSALAQAAWDQPWSIPAEWTVQGNAANYPDAAIAGTGDAPLYRSCRYDLGTVRLRLANGSYKVTLKFCEPHFKSAGERIFDVRLQGETVLTNLDIFARVGQFAALDFSFGEVIVNNGEIALELVPRKSLPCISAIAVEGAGFVRRFNCGGPAYQDWAADLSRTLPVDDHYLDWAQANFGLPAAGRVFAEIDGKVPRCLSDGCPCGAPAPVKTPWSELAPQFSYIDRFEALRPAVRGAGNLDRFDYWLNVFKYTRSLARLRCALGADGNSAEIARLYSEAYGYLLSTVNTPGALAMVVNMENHPGWHAAIAPRADQPFPKNYQGRPRLIVPTVRSLVNRGEALKLRVMVLSNSPLKPVSIRWRALGAGPWAQLAAVHVARGVYEARLPEATADFEYYITAGKDLVWPAAAPSLNQTVVLLEK